MVKEVSRVSLINDDIKAGIWLELGRRLIESPVRAYKSAIECFDRILKENPTDWLAYYYKGIALYHLGQTDDCVSQFKSSSELMTPEEMNTYRIGKFMTVLTYLERIHKDNPSNISNIKLNIKILQVLGRIHELLGEYEEGRLCYAELKKVRAGE